MDLAPDAWAVDWRRAIHPDLRRVVAPITRNERDRARSTTSIGRGVYWLDPMHFTTERRRDDGILERDFTIADVSTGSSLRTGGPSISP